MNGLTIFMLGVVAMSNVGLILYLFTDRNKSPTLNNAVPTEEDKPKNEPSLSPADKNESRAHVGKSKTVIKTPEEEMPSEKEESFQEIIEKKFEAMEQNMMRMAALFEMKMGAVSLHEVEFTDEKSETSRDETTNTDDTLNVESPKNARMSKEQEDASFGDIRYYDVENEISAPVASGATMEDIEKSVDITVNPGATPDEKHEAAEVLRSVQDTQLFDLFGKNPIIEKGIIDCLEQDMRERIADKESRKSAKKTATTKKTTQPKTNVKNPANDKFYLPSNMDDFNPADYV